MCFFGQLSHEPADALLCSSSWSRCSPHQPSPCPLLSLPATRRYRRRRWTCPARRSPSTRAGTTKTRRGEDFGGLILCSRSFCNVSSSRCADSRSASPRPPATCLPHFRIARVMGLVSQACKRPQRAKTSSKRKKPRIKDLLYAPRADSQRYAAAAHACHSSSPHRIHGQV